MRLLVVCDRKGWAFDSIARSLKKFMSGEDIDIAYRKSDADLKNIIGRDYDNILWMGWSLAVKRKRPFLKKLFKKKIKFKEIKLKADTFPKDPKDMLIGVHAHHDWDDRSTTPESDAVPPKNLLELLSRFKRVNTVSTRLYDLFKKSGLKNIFCTLNGVDDEVFYPYKKPSLSKKLIVGYAGTRKRDWKENISRCIDPLDKIDFIDLRLATPQDNYILHSQMPQFYNDIDVYLCASSSEGFSLSVLEASSCGRPVVSTRVGGSEDLIIDGYNGLFVKRDLGDIVDKLRYLYKNRDKLIEMGRNNRKAVEEKWSWKIRCKDWARFLIGDTESESRE